MTYTEIALRGVGRLPFCSQPIATIEMRRNANGTDALMVQFDNGANLKLEQAVDDSDRRESPRIFVIEVAPSDTFLLFGGPKAYWLTTEGTVLREMILFRERLDQEYWTTQLVESSGMLFVIYEGGVLAIDKDLGIKFHTAKMYNDDFVGIEPGALKFVSDHEEEWSMGVEDGLRQP